MGNDLERVANSLERLYGSGTLSEGSAKALGRPETAIAIEGGLGKPGTGREVLLVSILVDDSTSVATNLDEIRLGYSKMLKALRAESSTADVQVHTRALNRGVLSPYTPLQDIGELASQGYDGSRLAPRTPLYLQSLLTLGSVITKTQEEEARGARVRTFTLIVTDAEDNSSGDVTASQVRGVVTDMLEFATNHIVAGMGVGERVNFYEIFESMGIPQKWIFSAGADVDTLRAKFHIISESLSLAAAGEIEFLQLEAGPPDDDS
jgi:hypothetical protein